MNVPDAAELHSPADEIAAPVASGLRSCFDERATNLSRSTEALGVVFRTVGRLFMKTVAQGAATSVFAATAPELEAASGAYLSAAPSPPPSPRPSTTPSPTRSGR